MGEFTREDLIRLLGPPDLVIANDGGGLRSQVWTCAECGHVSVFRKAVRPPSPCACGSMAFEVKGAGAVPD